MANYQDSFLSGGNIEFIEALYARYLEDPSAVDESWRKLFSQFEQDGFPIFAGQHTGGAVAISAPPLAPVVHLAAGRILSERSMGLQARVDQTITAFRLRGHLIAELDPLGMMHPSLDNIADLGMVRTTRFEPNELEEVVASSEVFEAKQVKLKDLLERLRRTYCSHIGVEYMQILDSERRRWLQPRMERSENRTAFSKAQKKRILQKLSYAEQFENFLHTKYITAKRFSLDGGESLIPMIDTFLEVGGELGIREVVIGMAHRGRLNMLTNILGKSPDQIFSEFSGPVDPKLFLNRGDVKYHQGFSNDYKTQNGKSIHLSLSFNPSHLEVVYPVVEGRVRAKQDRYDDRDRTNLVPLVIHGDAAFSGQGTIAETLNLSLLKGYHTGGTVHIVINNQVGFTTDPDQGRSSHYATAVAQLLDIPIFHVNGDDPEACVHVMKLATEYRQTFHTDVVIDLVCFRRYGHNEGDEPAYTQPTMYDEIRRHPTVRTLYAQKLVAAGELTAEEAEAVKRACLQEFEDAHERAKQESRFKEPSAMEGLWKNWMGGPDKATPQVKTGIPLERAQRLLTQLSTVPADFNLHPKLVKLFERRLLMAKGEAPLDWAAGELLSYASLLTDNHAIRLTGQDTERGTFSHRHAVLHDVKTGARYVPLEHLAEKQGRCLVLNSPLSEMGCLGFEFGYSLDYPDALVAWEAQFGDFSNNAQVIIDQFIAATEDKWKRLSGLTLLLPHGYEGMGPEHSSARLERFLQLCAEDNLQVAYPTTPSQIFHLLRRQVIRPLRKPLIVMTPKSMLRKEGVVSTLTDFTEGTFKRLIPDAEVDPENVTRLLLCSGKIFYDLLEGRAAKKDHTIAIARVEQLYPLPDEEITAMIQAMPNLTEIYWVQEEPKNNGAWWYMLQALEPLVSRLAKKAKFGFIGRVESASPATGFKDAHDYEQKLIVDEATQRGN